jgi:uncharacterized membrane protein YraQ (UPF0718 family)
MDAQTIVRELTGLGQDLWAGILHIFWYFLAGIALAGWIRTYKFHVRLRKRLPSFGGWAALVAVGVAIVSPLCACGVLPIMVSLLTAGMPLTPCMALLVASPLMSVEGYAVTAGLLGPEWANAKLVAAIFMGLWAALVTHLVERRGGFGTAEIFRGAIPQGDMHDHDCDPRIACNCPDRWSNRIARRHPNKFVIFLAKSAETGWKVGRFIVVGLLIEVLASRYVDPEWIGAVFASTKWYTTVLVTLGSVPLHVNQFTAAGILFGPLNVLEKMGSTVSWGSGMAFLIGGPVTALPAMAVFLSLFKPRVFWLYLAICLSGTLIVAFAAQFLLG